MVPWYHWYIVSWYQYHGTNKVWSIPWYVHVYVRTAYMLADIVVAIPAVDLAIEAVV
jgi:hypothetical protein